MTEEFLQKFTRDVARRMEVHGRMWYEEVVRELGEAKARVLRDKVTVQVAENMAQRRGNKPELSLDDLSKCWLAQDGFWFQAVEFSEDMATAKKCNDNTWRKFSPFEAECIKKLLDMGDAEGLKGLQRALDYRIYARLNKQSSGFEGEALVFKMNDCRVQSARVRKGLPDYPCKSAGLVEYSCFAKGVDGRIAMECLGCPPDPHPEDWFCAWKFCMEE